MYSSNNQNSTAIAEKDAFVLPAPMDDSFNADELSEDMEGLRLTFPKIKIPSGGGIQFEMASDNPDRPDYLPELEGILLYNHSANAYWQEGEEYNENTPPLCQSVDGKIGHGTPGGLCASCGFNEFGSAGNKRGKACKNMRTLYLLRRGELLPLQISLPPTSIRPYNAFYNAVFALRRRPIYSSVIQIGLKKASSNGHNYSVATFCEVRNLFGQELEAVKAYAEGFREQVRSMLSEQAVNQAREASAVEVSSIPMNLPDNEGHFSVGVLDGAREKLPA